MAPFIVNIDGMKILKSRFDRPFLKNLSTYFASYLVLLMPMKTLNELK